MSLPVIPAPPPVPRWPAPAPTATAFNHAVAVSKTQAAALTKASGTAEAPRGSQGPGCDLSRWPVELLGHVLRYLDPFDLIRVSGVCRHWRHVASDPRLQAYCFRQAAEPVVQAWPPHHRERLQQALTQGPGRQRLALWYEQLVHRLGDGPELARRLLDQDLPPQALFYSLTQQMLHARSILCHFDRFTYLEHWWTGQWASQREHWSHSGEHWTYDSEDGDDWLHNGGICGAPAPDRPEPVPFSPDANYLVLHGQRGNDNDLLGHEVWWRGSQTLCKTAQLMLLHDDVALNGVTFSADNRKLLIVERSGRLKIYGRSTIPPRRSVAPSGMFRLCRTLVTAVKFSPDASCLALQTGRNIHLFTVPVTMDDELGEEDMNDEDWPPSITRRWTSREPPGDQKACEPHAMQFSADSQRFLFVKEACFIFSYQQGNWQWRELWHPDLPRPDFIGSAVLTARGNAIALACTPQSEPATPRPYHIMEVWHFTEDRYWHCSLLRHRPDTGRKLPLAFSPDGQQLVFTDRFETGETGVTVMSCHRDAHWKPCARLRCHPDLQGACQDTAILNLTYSGQGRYLAAIGQPGIQLWQYAAGLWTEVRWIENPRGMSPRTDPLFVFSPDGNHCALSTGRRQTVRIYGPGPDGHYRRKMQFKDVHHIYRLQFSPDGLNLLVSFSYAEWMQKWERHAMHILRLEPARPLQTLVSSPTNAS